MPIPPLNDEGYLPAGVHDCTLDEIGERFGRFQDTDRRVKLFESLRTYVQALRRTDFGVALIVDGGFVTGKSTPSDIDLILLTRSGWRMPKSMPPIQYNLISTRWVRTRRGFDLFVAPEDSDACREWVEFFQRERGRPEIRKGILRVTL